MTGWTVVSEELARWRTADRAPVLWWRDDDAADATPALDRLLALHRTTGVPLALAIVPANATLALAARLAQEPGVDLLQHGYAHTNHAPQSDNKKMELGLHRPAMFVLGELGTGRMALERLFGSRPLPVLVPPWNRIAPALVPTLPEVGYRGLSTFGARRRVHPVSGLLQVNTHVDLIDWKTRRFAGTDALLATFAQALASARTGTGEPIGILSHHLAMDEGAWDFLQSFWGDGNKHAGHENRAGTWGLRVTGGAGLSSADLRYPRQTLWADYLRAGTGAVLCGLPLLLIEVNRWVALLLAAGFVLFGIFFVRTALRQRTRYVLGPDTLCADGPAGTLVEWNRLDRMKLSYFSTKRDRSDGWMQLAVGSVGSRVVRVDSALEGFYDIVERAARAAEATGLELSVATRANLRSMGISVAGQEETA